MSVIPFGPETFGKIGDWLIIRCAYGSNRNWFTLPRESLEITDYARSSKESETDLIKNKIQCWCDRLYVSNQVCYHYQYCQDELKLDLHRLETKDFNQGSQFTIRTALSELRSIRYNLITNTGHTFTGGPDQERLDAMIEKLMYEIIEEMNQSSVEKDLPID